MSERAGLYELSKTLKAWERKVEISEVIILIKLSFVFNFEFLL